MIRPPSVSDEAVPSETGGPENASSSNGNAYAHSNDAINSLGDALAGVNIGGGFVFDRTTNTGASSPFPLGSNHRDIGWDSSFVDTNKTGFSRSSSMPPESTAAPLTPNTPVRKQSIELFLSQSPSRSLGNDVLKLKSTNLPALSMTDSERRNPPASAPNFGFAGQALAPGPVGTMMSSQGALYGGVRHDPRQKQDRDSPSCSVTGTTSSSRSVSPHVNAAEIDNRRMIHAYQGYDSNFVETYGRRQASFGEEDRTGGGSTLARISSHSQIAGLETQRLTSSPFGGVLSVQPRNVSSNDQYLQSPERTNSFPPFQMDKGLPGAQQQSQSQVLYMAVPTPDGRGQMLQPVQMVQLPGQQFAYVVPGSGVVQANVQDGGQQQLMILPSLPSQQGPDSSMVSPPVEMRKQPELRLDAANFNQENENQFFVDNANGLRDDFSAAPAQVGFAEGSQRSAVRVSSPYTVSSLYATPQRPPLDQLLGQVRRLSRDQVGCRLVQQALDEEGPMAATLILNEGLPFWGEAMVDPFGNYLFQKILEKITPGERIMLVRSVSSRLVNASLNLHGTRSVQKLVELCAIDEVNSSVYPHSAEPTDESAADVLTRSLAPAAARLCIDSHGNHVIQRILLKLGHKHATFVFDAVAASVGDVARHRHGCCVIQRCLDSPPSEARSHLVRRIVDKSLELMQDAYGNYVVQYVLDVCSDEDVHAVCESVVGKVSLLAIQKFSSNVMEKCLERCTDRVKDYYLQELSDPERIRELMMDPFGNYVVQRALSVATHAQAVRLVEAMRPHLIASHPGAPNGQRNGGMRNTAGGRRILAKICRRFPNFTLSAVGSPDDLYNQNKSNHRLPQHHQTAPPMPMAPAPMPSYPLQGFGGDPHRGHAHQHHPFYDTTGSSSYYEHMPNGPTAYPHM